MADYKHILVTIDFTPDNTRVGQRALDLAKRYGARITLLHVVEPVPVDPANELMLPPAVDVESRLLEQAERKLKEFSQSMEMPDANRQVTVGQTKHEILSHAEHNEVDLIVVGSHGRHGLALLLGSTANAVLHGAQCDVLAVRI